MKKIYLILISLCMMSVSCVNNSSPQVIGFSVANGSESTDIVAGPDDIADVWATYIDAHNSRDIEGIRALNADEFSAFGPAGEVVEGSDAHIAFLTEWFEANNPRWTILTAGHEVTLTVDGTDVKVYQVIDANVSDGKIVNFNVFQQERGQPSSE